MGKFSDSKAKGKANDGFPLWLHPSGRWCKKIRQRVHYFGRDKDAALLEWLRVKDELIAGKARPDKGEGVTVKAMCDKYMTDKKELIDTGDLSPRTWHSYYASCAKLAAALGRTTLVEWLTPDDFRRLRSAIAKEQAPATVRGDVLNIRGVFKYAFDIEQIKDKPRYGQGFKIPDKPALRRARQASGERMFEAADLRNIIKAAPQPLRAMVLLGVNCAFGATDLSRLPLTAVDLKGGIITFPRPKTAIERRTPLWAETIAALREVLDIRKVAKLPEDAGLVFLTRTRQRWVRVGTKGAVIDAVANEFAKLLDKLELRKARVGFYALRHTFRTIADEVHDTPAINRVMGHTDGSQADAYRERIGDDRLREVTDHVHRWLFGKPAGPARRKS